MHSLWRRYDASKKGPRCRCEMELHIQSQEVHSALTQLLQRQGVYGSEEDIIVKESTTRTGRALYIVSALNGAEPVVKSEIAAISGPRAYCGAGVWVLRQEEICELIRKASL